MLLFHTLPQQVWALVMLSVCSFAFWRGGRPERAVAAAVIVAWLGSAVLENQRDWISPQWGDLLVNGAFLALLIGLALRTDRRWTLWAAAFQLLGVVTYVARMADPRVGALAPYQAVVIWSYLVMIALAVGTWLHWRGGRAR